jgi:hypothetical protein
VARCRQGEPVDRKYGSAGALSSKGSGTYGSHIVRDSVVMEVERIGQIMARTGTRQITLGRQAGSQKVAVGLAHNLLSDKKREHRCIWLRTPGGFGLPSVLASVMIRVQLCTSWIWETVDCDSVT